MPYMQYSVWQTDEGLRQNEDQMAAAGGWGGGNGNGQGGGNGPSGGGVGDAALQQHYLRQARQVGDVSIHLG